MYTLRVVEKNGQYHNANLGQGYTVAYKHESGVAWRKYCAQNKVEQNVYGIVIAENDRVVFPLCSGWEYFIMTERGKTFERL